MALIERDVLIKRFCGHCIDYGKCIEKCFDVEIIESIPPVDAVPVIHGKWLDDGQYDNFFPHHEWRCSECGEHVLEIGAPWFKYCPNCGARMDEERKEE